MQRFILSTKRWFSITNIQRTILSSDNLLKRSQDITLSDEQRKNAYKSYLITLNFEKNRIFDIREDIAYIKKKRCYEKLKNTYIKKILNLDN